MKKVFMTIYITPEQYAQLKALSEKSKVPMSVYVREAIDLRLDQEGQSDGRNR